MHPTLALLDRLRDDIEGHVVHWFDIPEPDHPLVEQQHRQFNLNWSEQNSATLDTDVWPCAELNILFYPKAKERLHWWLNHLRPQLSKTHKLWVVGENNGGIKSLAKRLKSHYECVKIDSARHCAVFELIPLTDDDLPIQNEQYQHQSRTYQSLPGVFSAGKLDKGSDVLLKVLPALRGNILEFGGGCGVLTATLAAQPSVNQVTAVEIDLLAVRASELNLKANGLSDKATTIWSAGTQNLPVQRFDAIVTNPPFHSGIKTEYGPTEAFFRQAKDWLKPRGRFIWVANDFLEYQHLLQGDFSAPQLLAQERGFRVFEATRL